MSKCMAMSTLTINRGLWGVRSEYVTYKLFCLGRRARGIEIRRRAVGHARGRGHERREGGGT